MAVDYEDEFDTAIQQLEHLKTGAFVKSADRSTRHAIWRITYDSYEAAMQDNYLGIGDSLYDELGLLEGRR